MSRRRPAQLLLAAALCGVCAPALAQGVQPAGTQARAERAVQMSEDMYRRLTAIHGLLAEDELAEARTALDALRRQNLDAYEEALILQTEGYLHMQSGDHARAIVALERCLELDVLSNLAQQSTRYTLAGLLAGEGRFEEAVTSMLTWLRFAQEPVAPEAYMLIGSSYAELDELDAALPYVREAIGRAEAPNESWYRLELSIHFENMDYESAAELLRRMVVNWPDNAGYWEMLASAYTELEEQGDALAVLMVAYRRGLLTGEDSLTNLARLNLFMGIPFEAGRLLETEMANGRVAATRDHLELLLSASTAAREFERAIGVVDQLARLSDDGRYALVKARLLMGQSDWPGVVEASEQALAQGGIERPGDAWILKGMAHAELAQYDAALAAFEEASRLDDGTQRNAVAWIDYVRDRRQVAVNGR